MGYSPKKSPDDRPVNGDLRVEEFIPDREERDRVTTEYWSKVGGSEDSDECRPWRGAIWSHGYGRFSVKGMNTTAHRFAYLFAFGEIPAGTFVCHRCDNPLCCNPNHLFAATNRENQRDAVGKGRHHSGAKLGIAEVRSIRARLAEGESWRTLAKEFRVDPSAIAQIARGKTWRGAA